MSIPIPSNPRRKRRRRKVGGFTGSGGCIVMPGSPADRYIEKARREGRLVRVTWDKNAGTLRPITPAEAAKADARMKPLLDFIATLPKE